MPRETIYGSELPYGPEDSGRSVVELTWSREAEYVQLVTKCVDASTGGKFEISMTPTAVGGGVNASSAATATQPDFKDGFHVQLDRRAINEMIRKLRRARDQAFGKDE